MKPFLALTNNYTTFSVALFNETDIIDLLSEHNSLASKKLIPMINSLLEKNSLTLKDVLFIAINQGPGPFTTLRSLIACVNGISFAQGTPLVGIDGMRTFVQEYESKLFPYTIALFNAFNKDVYFGIQEPGQSPQTGYKNYLVLLEELKTKVPVHIIRFIGSGTIMYEEEIKSIFGNWATIPDPLPLEPSITQIGLIGLEQWNKKINVVNQLLPLYLKKLTYKKI